MIDWYALFANALWVIGLAVVLAAISWSFYAASRSAVSVRRQLAAPGFNLAASLGMMLVMLGLALQSEALWQIPIWLVMAVIFAYKAWLAWQERNRLQPDLIE